MRPRASSLNAHSSFLKAQLTLRHNSSCQLCTASIGFPDKSSCSAQIATCFPLAQYSGRGVVHRNSIPPKQMTRATRFRQKIDDFLSFQLGPPSGVTEDSTPTPYPGRRYTASPTALCRWAGIFRPSRGLRGATIRRTFSGETSLTVRRPPPNCISGFA